MAFAAQVLNNLVSGPSGKDKKGNYVHHLGSIRVVLILELGFGKTAADARNLKMTLDRSYIPKP